MLYAARVWSCAVEAWSHRMCSAVAVVSIVFVTRERTSVSEGYAGVVRAAMATGWFRRGMLPPLRLMLRHFLDQKITY